MSEERGKSERVRVRVEEVGRLRVFRLRGFRLRGFRNSACRLCYQYGFNVLSGLTPKERVTFETTPPSPCLFTDLNDPALQAQRMTCVALA